MPAQPVSTWLTMLLLAGLTIACLAPFTNKAFHIDDPLFIWTADHIRQYPLDFYGYDVLWDHTTKPVYKVTQNPPLASYYIALVRELLGEGEIVLHIAFMLPAIAVVLGTWLLGRRMCQRPTLAAVIALVTPVMLVSATTVMCDVMMLAIWVWALVIWDKGLKNKNTMTLLSAAILMGLCGLTKYFGFAVVPLAFVYAAMREKRIGAWILYLVIPIMFLIAYQWYTQHQYGRDMIGAAMEFATRKNRGHLMYWLRKGAVGLGFAGGCLVVVLFLVHQLWSWRTIAIGGAVAAGLVVMLCILGEFGRFPLRTDTDELRWATIISFAIYSVIGLGVMALAVDDIRKKPDADATLLFLWIVGTFVFATFINWTINGRSILPMVPALGLLLVRRIDQRIAEGKLSLANWQVYWPLVPAAAIALLVARADYGMAQSAKTAADKIALHIPDSPQTMYFQGHWGLQYYLQLHGAKPMDKRHTRLYPGDRVALASNNYGRWPIRKEHETIERLQLQSHPWIMTMSPPMGAGFYATRFGPLPYAIGHTPDEKYKILEIKPAPRVQ